MKNLQDFIDEFYDYAEESFAEWQEERRPKEKYQYEAYLGDWAEQLNKDYDWELTDAELDEVIDAVADLLLD